MSTSSRRSKISLVAGVVLVLLLVAGATPYLISSVDDSQEIVEEGVGEDVNTHVTLGDNVTVEEVTSWLTVEIDDRNTTENYVVFDVHDDLSNKTKRVVVEYGTDAESKTVDFDAYSVTLEVDRYNEK